MNTTLIDTTTPIADTTLTDAEVAVVEAYVRIANGRRFYSPTLSELALVTGYSRAQVHNLARQLEQKGWMHIHRGSKRSLELMRLADGTEVDPWYA